MSDSSTFILVMVVIVGLCFVFTNGFQCASWRIGSMAPSAPTADPAPY